jgi:hypothetical protein
VNVVDHSAANAYLADLRRSFGLASAAHDTFVSLGCGSYVKTIYIGYDIGGEMVAALYGHADHVEIALALPDDLEDPMLVDASHLTWRTLPVAALLRSSADLKAFNEPAALACNRVKSSQHDIHRDNDFFVRAKHQRRP